MYQKDMIIDYLKKFGSIIPAKMGGKFYKGQIFGSETGRRCRKLREENKLVSEKKGRFTKYMLAEKEKKKHYFTFGQTHVHNYNGMTIDKDCVIEIESDNSKIAREKMFELFGSKWGFQYSNKPDMSFYSRGIIKIETIDK